MVNPINPIPAKPIAATIDESIISPKKAMPPIKISYNIST